MHQAHNIPWDIISSLFKYVKDDKSRTPCFTGLIPIPSKSNDHSKRVIHFINKFTAVIQEFSLTERGKYLPSEHIELQNNGKLFPDDYLGLPLYKEYLNEDNQRVEYWISRSRRDGSGQVCYNCHDGDLADAVKALLSLNHLAPLLMMARHPAIPLRDLAHIHWGHHFGFSRVLESALHAYVFFNCAEATGILHNGVYSKLPEYERLLYELGCSMDYPAQQVPHRLWLERLDIYSASTRSFKGGHDRWKRGFADSEDLHIHNDGRYANLQQYMKECFELMYRYNLFARECGIDPCWEMELAFLSPFNKVVKVEDEGQRLEAKGSWTSGLSARPRQ